MRSITCARTGGSHEPAPVRRGVDVVRLLRAVAAREAVPDPDRRPRGDGIRENGARLGAASRGRDVVRGARRAADPAAEQPKKIVAVTPDIGDTISTGLPVAWHRAELARLADARGVSLPVELLEHEAVPGPMTFGIRRPVIVLPLDAREWSEAELRRALMHEIEHIQRRDWRMQNAARTVAAFYWFHPLVWTAWRRLVSLAQRMSAAPAQPMLGMANRSDLSTRVTAVLDDRLKRGRGGFTLAAGTVAAAALVVLTVAPVRAIAISARA
ncbi:MAG: M56 family metallopeptidase [Cyanobacteria bacterium]|nr:M56 family metallopeptidase [Cyanobacteriota bacterium]